MRISKLNEIEKTTLLGLLILSKGSVEKHIPEEDIVSKFPISKRKWVRISLDKFIKKGLLVKHPKKNEYKLTKDGLKRASIILGHGAKLWKL